MKNAAELLQNLIYGNGYLKTTIKEGVAALKQTTLSNQGRRAMRRERRLIDSLS